MSSPPVLVSEARLCLYSETWGAALASELATQCSQNQVSVMRSGAKCDDYLFRFPIFHCNIVYTLRLDISYESKKKYRHF